MNNRLILAINALAAALLGAIGAQILHEACHGLTAVLVGFFWAFFLAAYWLDVHKPLPNPVALPDQPQTAWWIVAGLTFLRSTASEAVLAVAVLLPTIWFVQLS